MVLLHRNHLAVLLLASAVLACRRPPARTVAPAVVAKPVAKPQAPPPPELPLFLPRVLQPLAVDGELAESVWRDAAHSGGFRDEKSDKLGIPHSEARLANDGERLLLGLYAADEDIQAHAKAGTPFDARDDVFVVQIQRVGDAASYQIEATANGTVRETVTPPASKPRPRATCAVELDGTVNDATDDDEEWVVECVLPFGALDVRIGDTLLVSARRCDTPKGADKRCGLWQRRVQIQ